MAIFKAVTRRDGTAIGRKSPKQLEDYLKFQTDERGRVQYDEQGEPLRRDGIITALNGDADNFALSCRETFAQFGVNQKRGSLQYKHYVQGFPPEDNDRMDRETCHRLGVELAKTVWKDFPVLVVSHFDQENDGRYHWHNHFVVGNCNVKTGQKLCTSADMMWAQKRFVAAQADANGLARRGLILQDGRILESQQGDRITFGEYQLGKRLEKRAKGMTPEQIREMNVLTQKAELRFAIKIAANETANFAEFCTYLKEHYDIDVKETRGAISYMHPERREQGGSFGRGWIRGRSLGTAYEKEAILHVLAGFENRPNRGGANVAAETGAIGGAAEVAAGKGVAGGAAAPGDAVGLTDDAAVAGEESAERLAAFYRELYPELFGADEREAGRAAGRGAGDEQTDPELAPGGDPVGGDGVRSGRGQQI